MTPKNSAPRSSSLRRVAAEWTALTAEPGGEAVSEVLHGEAFNVEIVQDGWVKGVTLHDGYAGWIAEHALGDPQNEPTHIAVHRALAFDRPDIKSAHRSSLPIGALLHVDSESGAFVRASGAFVHRRHVVPIGTYADPVETARLYLGQPYLWGGRGGGGIDCSGLVQQCLARADIAAPRDSGPQRDTIGTHVAVEDAQRGDLVFVPGHVGLLAENGYLIHANAHWMSVVEEPLTEVLQRLPEGIVPAIRRPAPTQT